MAALCSDKDHKVFCFKLSLLHCMILSWSHLQGGTSMLEHEKMVDWNKNITGKSQYSLAWTLSDIWRKNYWTFKVTGPVPVIYACCARHTRMVNNVLSCVFKAFKLTATSFARIVETWLLKLVPCRNVPPARQFPIAHVTARNNTTSPSITTSASQKMTTFKLNYAYSTILYVIW